MMPHVYIRPLSIEDACISYKWRNNPNIWTYTKFKPLNEITLETESEWLSNCLQRKNECRFAICIEENNQYIGNVQLTNIDYSGAEFHIFIGEEQYWGKGIGKKASDLILKYAFNQLKLKTVTLLVHKENIPAIKVYEKAGFQLISSSDTFVKMILTKALFEKLCSIYKSETC